ncbi:MAG TPA: HAD-IC family P-type ATPase, partial [Chryseosolibacter sp.]
ERTWLPFAAALESQSTHPIAKAVADFASSGGKLTVQYVEEIKGYGLKGVVEGRDVLAGSAGLMQKFNIDLPVDVDPSAETVVFVAVEGKLCGYITIADEIREDAGSAIRQMHALNIRTVMLSGDKQAVVDRVAMTLNIDQAFGDLLPERKVEIVETIKRGRKEALAFAGDGINDAPVLAISDVGIAMGGLGSDAAIETADVVIQTDEPSKIVTAIHIGKATNTIVWQNIALAFGVKVVVLGLGAWGVASMWEAVFADVGVALLAILNAMRIQRMKFQ